MKPHDMGVLFDECAGNTTRVHLDRPFDIAPDGGTEYTVADLAELVRDAAAWLAAAGVRPGDRVAIVKDNHWDYDLLACAAVRIGAVPAQLSAHLPSEALATLLKRLDPAVLVTTGKVLAGSGNVASFAGTVLSLDSTGPGVIGLDDVRGHAAPAPHRRNADEPLVINHTSGTTGLPKLVVHSTGTIIDTLARAESVRYPLVGVRRDDTVANVSAYPHGRTFCWTASVFCLAPRAIVILADQDRDRADLVLRAHPPTIIEALPSAFVRLRPLTERLDNPFRDTRLFVSTYDAMHPPTVRAYLSASRRRWPLWMQGWGQTETGPLTFRFHTRKSLTGDPNTRDLGRPMPGKARLRVVDPETLQPVRRGQAGLVLADTPARCLGYVGEPGRWAAKQVGKWWNTGDIGVHRWNGNVRLLDREVDRTPELSCLETEDVLEDRLPGVIECVVLGIPGRSPLPVVVTPDGELDREQWAHAVQGLPALQAPVVRTWDQLPRTGTGKVRRLELLNLLTGHSETHGSGLWT